MKIHRVLSTAFALTAVTLALAACGGSATPTASPTTTTTVTPSTVVTPSAGASPTAAAAATIPTDCSTLATPATRQEAIGDLRLQSNGEGFVRPAPAGATLRLGCDWIVGDSTGMLLLVSTAPATAVSAAIPGLAAQGYSCQTSDDFGAEFCVAPGAGEDTEEMIVARDDVWIYLSTSNRNGRAFLSEIVSGVFG